MTTPDEDKLNFAPMNKRRMGSEAPQDVVARGH